MASVGRCLDTIAIRREEMGRRGNTWFAGVCYAIALSLYVRKWWRRRWTEGRIPLHRATTRKISNTYGAIDESKEIRDRDECKSLQGDDNDEDDGEASGVPGRPSPWTVISLTTLGALDEVSYFPSLLLGKIFTPLDFCALVHSSQRA